MIEPYRMQSGEVHGAPEPPAGARVRSSYREPRRAPNELVLRARRAKNDPTWASRSEDSKALLLALDRKEACR